LAKEQLRKRLGCRASSSFRSNERHVLWSGNIALAPIVALVKVIADCPSTGSIWPGPSISRDCNDPFGMFAWRYGRLSKLAGDFDPNLTPARCSGGERAFYGIPSYFRFWLPH